MEWTDLEVRSALGLAGGDALVRYSGVATDTRLARPGVLFVALEGERFDGHAFLAAARDGGATGAVVRTGTAPVEGLRCYEVDDTLRAYGRLARHRRRRLRGPVVAVTGTNGKTSTKEMLAAVLGIRYRTHATRLNLNNLVGVPQTILECPDDTEALIVEAGASLPGEIARYREIIEPDIAVITNVTAGHLEGFGSRAGVLAEKLALVQDVPLAIVAADEPDVAAGARRLARRVVTAGLEGADVAPDQVSVEPTGRPRVTVGGVTFTVAQMGIHQAKNAMLAWAVGRELGLAPAEVARGLESFTLPAGRGEVAQYGRLTILNDSYNANPASFRALIEVVPAMRSGRRLVFVAGTMRELGPEAAGFHADIAAALARLDPDLMAAVGEFGPALERYRAQFGDRLLVAQDAATMAPLVAKRINGDELVVLKGSRGVRLERIIPELVARTAN